MMPATPTTPNGEPQAPDKGLRLSNFTLRTTINPVPTKDQTNDAYHGETPRVQYAA